jgi:hypothetical protein
MLVGQMLQSDVCCEDDVSHEDVVAVNLKCKKQTKRLNRRIQIVCVYLLYVENQI